MTSDDQSVRAYCAPWTALSGHTRKSLLINCIEFLQTVILCWKNLTVWVCRWQILFKCSYEIIWCSLFSSTDATYLFELFTERSRRESSNFVETHARKHIINIMEHILKVKGWKFKNTPNPTKWSDYNLNCKCNGFYFSRFFFII